jgi:hypothetical protein
LWTSRLDDDYTLVLNDFGFHQLLLGGFQIAGILGLFSHALYGLHHSALLSQERIPQIRGPLNVVSQSLYDIRQDCHGLDAGIPRLLLDSIGKRFVFQPRVFRQPLLKLDQFERIGGRRQGLCQQRVWIKGNRRHERIQLIGWNQRSLTLGRRCVRRLRRRHIPQRVAWHEGEGTKHRYNASNSQTKHFRVRIH